MEELRRPQPGEFYVSFKGGTYQIIAIAEYSETGEELVIYQALYGGFSIYAKPLSEFVRKIDHLQYPDMSHTYYFERIDRKKGETESSDGADGVKEKDQKEKSLEKEDRIEKEKSFEKEECKEKNTFVAYSVEMPNRITETQRQEKLFQFLDADTYRKKLELLRDMKRYIDDKMINDMAVVLDIVIEEGNIEDRIHSLENCLKTMERFEDNRLR